MITAAAAPSSIRQLSAKTQRVASIDVFRGLTMAVMIFVNALSEVPGLPWWTYHAPANLDRMTYVDMVFPFFLFAVGLSMPLAVEQRLKRNASLPALWAHVALRFIGLLVLGLILANAEKCDSAHMPIGGATWALLGLLSGVLCLHAAPRSERWRLLSRVLRVAGLAGIAVLFALFRRTTRSGQIAWLDFSYPEILGLIGFAYLAASILFIPTRRWKWAAPAWFVLMVALCALSTARMIPLPGRLPLYIWPFGNGSMGCIIFAGIVISSLFSGMNKEASSRRAMLLTAGLGVLTLATGYALTPLGISKIRATPSWSLFSIITDALLKRELMAATA